MPYNKRTLTNVKRIKLFNHFKGFLYVFISRVLFKQCMNILHASICQNTILEFCQHIKFETRLKQIKKILN